MFLFLLFSLLAVKLRWGQRGILAVPLLLWVSLYRIFYMGRVFNFLGMWVEQSDISLALTIFTTQFLHLLCFGGRARDSSAPDPSQPCSSCSQCMLGSCPAVQRCRVAQLSPSQPAWSPLDPPARSSLTFPACCHLQSSQSPFAVLLFCQASRCAPSTAAGTVPAPPVAHAPGVGALHLGY